MSLTIAPAFADTIPATETVEVYSFPRGGATEAITRGIGKSRNEIRIQAYSFTSNQIAKALLDAKKLGAKIETVFDKSNSTAKSSASNFFFNTAIPVLIDDKHAIANNKIMIIDRATLIGYSGESDQKDSHETDQCSAVILIAVPVKATKVCYSRNAGGLI